MFGRGAAGAGAGTSTALRAAITRRKVWFIAAPGSRRWRGTGRSQPHSAGVLPELPPLFYLPEGAALSIPSIRELDRFRFVVDVQTVASQQHRSQQWILPIAGNDLRLVGLAEPIEKT